MPTTNLQPAHFPKTNWAKFDSQSVVMEDRASGREVVLHGKSAVENVKELGRNVADAFTPNHLAELNRPSGHYIADAFKIVLLPWALAAEAVDVAALPVKVAKNTVDAVAHGAMAAADKLVFWK